MRGGRLMDCTTGNKPTIMCDAKRPGGLPLHPDLNGGPVSTAHLLEDGSDDDALHHHPIHCRSSRHPDNGHARVTRTDPFSTGGLLSCQGKMSDRCFYDLECSPRMRRMATSKPQLNAAWGRLNVNGLVEFLSLSHGLCHDHLHPR